MDLTERLTAWSYARQGLAERSATPRAALDGVVAVYATHPTAPLALRARTNGLTPAGFRRLDADRSVLRIPAMRKTIFMVPRPHAAKIFSAVRPSRAHVALPLERQGIDRHQYELHAEGILRAARAPITSRNLQAQMRIDGAQLGVLLRALRYEGRIVVVPGPRLHLSQNLYVATGAWAPEGLDVDDPGAARAWLAGEYLRAYGPARVSDFEWWAGIGRKAAEAAMRSTNSIEIGEGLLLLAEDEGGFSKVRRVRDVVSVLPKWDSYTMGHAPDGRSRFVDAELQAAVYSPLGTGFAGDGNPVILVDGRVAAMWTFTLDNGPQVQPLETLGQRTRARIDDELGDVVRWLAS